jgi:hypothetical protein
MKRAVSISIGSSKRDKAEEVTLLGENISIQRIGTDGDMEALKYKELTVRWMHSGLGRISGSDRRQILSLSLVQKLTRYVEKTPVVDGGLRIPEIKPLFSDKTIGEYVNCGTQSHDHSYLDRWGLSKSLRRQDTDRLLRLYVCTGYTDCDALHPGPKGCGYIVDSYCFTSPLRDAVSYWRKAGCPHTQVCQMV